MDAGIEITARSKRRSSSSYKSLLDSGERGSAAAAHTHAAPGATSRAASARRQSVASPIAALSELDVVTGVLEALDRGYIRLLRTSWVLAQPSTYLLENRQQLEEREMHGEFPLLTAPEAVALVLRASRSAGVVSHGWLSPHHVQRSCASNPRALAASERVLGRSCADAHRMAPPRVLAAGSGGRTSRCAPIGSRAADLHRGLVL
jgi:hypothetical protein